MTNEQYAMINPNSDIAKRLNGLRVLAGWSGALARMAEKISKRQELFASSIDMTMQDIRATNKNERPALQKQWERWLKDNPTN